MFYIEHFEYLLHYRPRFGCVNSIYLRAKSRQGKLLALNNQIFIRNNYWNLCVGVVNSEWLFCNFNELVLDVVNKAFWYKRKILSRYLIFYEIFYYLGFNEIQNFAGNRFFILKTFAFINYPSEMPLKRWLPAIL